MIVIDYDDPEAGVFDKPADQLKALIEQGFPVYELGNVNKYYITSDNRSVFFYRTQFCLKNAKAVSPGGVRMISLLRVLSSNIE